MQMDATKGRLGLFSFGVWLPWSLAIIDCVWAQGEASFIAAGRVRGAENAVSITVDDFNGDGHQDLVTANRFPDTVSIPINDTSSVAVNDFVTFEPTESTFLVHCARQQRGSCGATAGPREIFCRTHSSSGAGAGTSARGVGMGRVNVSPSSRSSLRERPSA
jgi:hypothetical protein